MQKEILSSSAAEDTVQATNDLLHNILETFKLVIGSKIKPIVWMVTQGAAVGSVKAPGRIRVMGNKSRHSSYPPSGELDSNPLDAI